MNLPVFYKGKTENGWHRYYIELPFPRTHRYRKRTNEVGYRTMAHEVIMDRSRVLAWASAWWSWLNLRVTGDEI